MNNWEKLDNGYWQKKRNSGLLLDVMSAYGGYSWSVRDSNNGVPLYKGHTKTLETAKMLADETAVRRCE